jgi:nitrogen regulatory protein PII
MKDNLLPFEIVKSEEKDKKILAGLKKIEIYVSPSQVNDVILALEELRLEATLYNSQGFGQSKQLLRAGKSGGQNRILPSDRRTIVTIAESSEIEDLVEKIRHINDKNDKKIGILSIQPVDALVHL